MIPYLPIMRLLEKKLSGPPSAIFSSPPSAWSRMAMGRGDALEKSPENRDRRERGNEGGGERGEGVQERRKRQARRENTGVVCRKGGACQVRMRRRRGAGSLSRRELGPALRRSDETKPPRMLANNDLDRVIRPSLEMESLLMAAPVQRTKILLSFYCHQFVVSLTLRGKKYI